MKQQNFVFNICFLIFLNLLIKPFWILGIDVGVQNAVGAANYGLYFAVFNFTYLFNMLLDMGITNFNNRNIARHSQLLSKHLSGIITLKMLLGVVYLGVTFGVAAIIGYGKVVFEDYSLTLKYFHPMTGRTKAMTQAMVQKMDTGPKL